MTRPRWAKATTALATVGLGAMHHRNGPAPWRTASNGNSKSRWHWRPRPKLLLLDEPLAGMSRGRSAAIVALLQSLRGRYPMLLVER